MADGKRSSWSGAGSRDRWVKALSAPVNLVLLIGVLLVGIVAGAPLGLTLALAIVVYLSAVVRKLLEDQAPRHGLESPRPEHRDQGSATGVAPDDLAPEIRAAVEEVHRRAKKIDGAIQYADRPYDEVHAELAGFVNEAERSARAAQMLQTELPAARNPQRIESQLAGYHSEIERLCARLDDVADAHLSGSAGRPDEAPLAADLRGLREEMESLAAGVEDAYEEVPT